MNFNDSINLLSSVHKIIKMVFEIINLDVHARIKAENFNNFLYDNGKSSIDALRNKVEFMDLIGESCHFCYEEDKEGIINIPRTKFKFPYGPFLECDTCNAIVGPNLNLKQNKKKIEKIKCDNCNDEDAYYKLTSSYSKNSELYRRPKLQCNICKHIRDE